jgi:hypothetical protein
MKKILPFILPAIITYGLFAFIRAELNPFVWPMEIRGVCAVTAICATFISNLPKILH